MGFSPTFGARRFPKGEWKDLWCARRRKPFLRPGLTRRLRRGRWGCRLMGFHQLRCPKVSKGRAESPLVRPLAHTSCRRRGGIDAPTPARTVGLPPRGGQYFLSKRKKVPKKASGTVTLAARPAMRRGLRSAVAPSGLSSTLVRFAHPPGKSPLLPILPAGLVMSRAA